MKATISIVEDDAGLSNVFSGWLKQSKGLRLLSAFGDGESALAALPAQSPAVVLMDINLPGIDGVECVRRLKPLLPETQFVMVTVYEDAKRIVSALAAGATGYLLKRATREELLEAIDEVRAGGSPMTTSIARKVVQHFQQPPCPLSPGSVPLAPREQQVIDLIVRGYVNKEIAEQLQISIPTIKTDIRRIYEKLAEGAPMTPQAASSVLKMFATIARPRPDYSLTSREQQILEMLTEGLIKKEVADKLSLSYHTVDTHLRNIYSKLHVHSRIGAVAKALKERLF